MRASMTHSCGSAGSSTRTTLRANTPTRTEVSSDPDGWYGNNNNMFFTSSDPSVAEVDNPGNIYGVSESYAIITTVTRTSGI